MLVLGRPMGLTGESRGGGGEEGWRGARQKGREEGSLSSFAIMLIIS